MGCGRRNREQWRQRMASWDKPFERWGGPGNRSSGNAAFDEYREATLKRLEDEQREFRAFLERLRAAKDKAEFDQFMAERREPNPGEAQPSQA